MAKGSGVVKVKDEDDLEIEALIQRELDALGEEDLLDDGEGLNQQEALGHGSDGNAEVEDPFQSSFSEYLDLLKYNQTKAAESLIESEKALDEALPVDSAKLELIVAEKLKDILDEDETNDDENVQHFLQLRTKALAEIEELNLKEEKEMLVKDETDKDKLAVAIIGPDIFEEIRQLEEQENKKLQILREKQMLEEELQNDLLMKRKEEENKESEEQEKQRALKMQEFEKNLGMSKEKEKDLARTKESEVSHIKEIEEQFQVKLKQIEREREKEEKEFCALKAKIEKERHQKQLFAALIIQSTFRGYRERMKYGPKLADMKVLRKQRERERLEKLEAEEKLLKEAEKMRRLELEEADRRAKERIEKQKLEKERLEKERIERMRLEKEQEELRRLEREREEERKRIEEEERVEKERMEREKKEKEREENERLEREKKEAERLENERRERERIENERREKESLEHERKERERLESERKEIERLANERKEKERLENERKERERLETERKEIERQEAERKEHERMEIERKEKEKKRLERLEMERIERERIQKRKIEEERQEKRMGQKKKQEQQRQEEQSNMEKERKEKVEQLKKDFMDETKVREGREKENLAITSIEAESETCIGQRPRLSEKLEEMRKNWIEKHIRYSSSTTHNRSHEVAKRRPSSRFAKSLETLAEISPAQILKAAPDGANLQTCECIVLSDLDEGIRMKGIDRCPKLRVIKMKNCNLQAIEDLGSCECIEKLDLPQNKIDFLRISTQVSLQHLSLPNNNLSSTNGLDCLPNLEVLDLSSNRITRIGSISSCKKLQSLNIDENQLITLKGIEGLQGLVDLKAARNYLGNAKEIENLPLLTRLDLHSNTINMLPSFKNHVLLRHLDVHGNNIPSLEPLGNFWLPSLESIHIAGNRIEELPVLDNLLMVSVINLQDNVIRECSNFLAALENCRRLSVLKISGNPVVDTPDLRLVVQNALPQLNQLDDMKFEHTATKAWVDTDLEQLCILQRNEQVDLDNGYLDHTRKFEELIPYNAELERLEKEKRFRDSRLKLLLRHLQQHENFGIGGDEVKPMAKSNDLQYDIIQKEASPTDGISPTRKEKDELDSPTAEREFQSEDIKHNSKQEIKEEKWTSLHVSAATKIQAVYRGYRVRQIILSVLESARQQSNNSEDDDDDDFNYDEEVDLAAFDFDDDGNEWRPDDTPQLPPRSPALPSKEFSNNPKNMDIPYFPKHAWESMPRTPQPSTAEKVERLDLELSPEQSDQASTVPESAVSKKKDELAMEWGFQNSNTADLMMKRAKKMKSSARKNNFLSLAPDKRYALFKKLQQSNSNMTVRPPAKNKPNQRVEYFAAQREINPGSRLSNISTDRDFKDKMTYSWICNQAVLHSDTYQDIISEREKDHKTKTRLETKQTKRKDVISLPYMDPAIIAGRNLPLVLLSSRNASNPSLASQSERKTSIDRVRKGHSSEKSRSAPNPSVRSPPVFNLRDSSSSRSSSSESRGRKTLRNVEK